jgi:hypothetical protein
MHCNGKCQLRKKLQQLEQGHSEHSSTPVKIDKLENSDCVLINQIPILIKYTAFKKLMYAIYKDCYAYAYSNKLWRPPSFFKAV